MEKHLFTIIGILRMFIAVNFLYVAFKLGATKNIKFEQGTYFQ
jgi:hypothetical protein